MANTEKFKELYLLADQLIAESDKTALSEVARLLAINLAHYQLTYDDLPLDDVLACLSVEVPNDQQMEMLSVGMGNLVGALQTVMAEAQDDHFH